MLLWVLELWLALDIMELKENEAREGEELHIDGAEEDSDGEGEEETRYDSEWKLKNKNHDFISNLCPSDLCHVIITHFPFSTQSSAM